MPNKTDIKIVRVRTPEEAKAAEKFLFESLKPGGFSHDPTILLPSLKDKLAWLSWANISRPEQPGYIVKHGVTIVGGIFGEPVETTFDVGEAEIQEWLLLPEYENEDTVRQLISAIVAFYKEHDAKQIHFWMIENRFNKQQFTIWERISMDSFGFAFKGFRRISKWRGVPIVKIEKVF
jgi:hypothetical protein